MIRDSCQGVWEFEIFEPQKSKDEMSQGKIIGVPVERRFVLFLPIRTLANIRNYILCKVHPKLHTCMYHVTTR